MNNDKNHTIGIDVGGTKMSAVLFGGKNIIAKNKLPTPKDNLKHFMAALNALIEPLLKKARKDKIKIKGIGLGVPGPVNYKERKISICNNIKIIAGAKIADQLQTKTGLSVKTDNDTRCFMRGEALMGAGRKFSNIYGIIIGTGIGGAWWHEKKVYQGVNGAANEFNKMVIDFKSGIGLEEEYHNLTKNDPAKLAKKAYSGDISAKKTFKKIGQNLGTAFANIVNLIDPEIIIIGGGVMKSSDLFLPAIKKNMRKHIFSPKAKKIKILKSELGEYAGAIGAALLIA